jgi:hypothetical protein
MSIIGVCCIVDKYVLAFDEIRLTFTLLCLSLLDLLSTALLLCLWWQALHPKGAVKYQVGHPLRGSQGFLRDGPTIFLEKDLLRVQARAVGIRYSVFMLYASVGKITVVYLVFRNRLQISRGKITLKTAIRFEDTTILLTTFIKHEH